MKIPAKIQLFLLVLLTCAFHLSASNRRIWVPEAEDPDTTFVDWSIVKGFHYSFGTTNERYAKSAIPNIRQTSKWKGTAWRGEKISAQIVLWSSKDVDQIKFEFSPFKSSNGSKLNSSIAQARFVRYVLTDCFGSGCGYRKPENFPVSLSADALDNVECFDMKANTTRPVWLTFDIPQNAKPGIYTSTLKLSARKEKTKKLKVTIEVLPQTLPNAKEWEFHLDLWQHPSAVARVHGVEVWSEEHWSLLEKPMKMLADAGQKVITANINKEPWNNQCFDPYADMIFWTKKADGSWEYDYTIFDRWIQFMMDLGINKQINCYSMVPWNNEIHYTDEKTGKLINVSAKPGSEEFVALWTPFLRSFKKHLETKGWFEITNIAMDERSPADMDAALKVLNEAAPGMGTAIADNHRSYRKYTTLKDVCLGHPSVFSEEDLAFRKERGLINTYYVCCSHRFPNIFTFSDPSEATFIAWYATAAGFDGFLHWAYNSWVENPLIDSRFRTWPAGDTYVIYPDGRSSIRFERLLEGIQDAEKIRILREKFKTTSETDKLKRLNDVVSTFNINEPSETSCAELVDNGKKILEELSRINY